MIKPIARGLTKHLPRPLIPAPCALQVRPVACKPHEIQSAESLTGNGYAAGFAGPCMQRGINGPGACGPVRHRAFSRPRGIFDQVPNGTLRSRALAIHDLSATQGLSGNRGQEHVAFRLSAATRVRRTLDSAPQSTTGAEFRRRSFIRHLSFWKVGLSMRVEGIRQPMACAGNVRGLRHLEQRMSGFAIATIHPT